MSFPSQRAFDALQSTLEDMYQQREQCLERLIIYRDDHPKFFIPTMEGFTPEVVDLKMPTFDPRDVEKLLRLPEPKRAAKWLQMGFVACDEQLSSPSLFWKEYKAMFGPLLQEASATNDESQQEKPSADGSQAHAPGNEPMISSHNFFLTLFRAIHGVRLYGSRDDSIGQVIVRGIRARTVALTFPSTNRARSLRQLRWYKEQDEVSEPKSLFAKKLAEDPLFMTAAKHDRKKSPDGEKTENVGFPGVALRKRDKMLDQAWSAPERLFECVGLAESGGLKSDGGMTIWAAQRAVHEMMEEAAASGKGRPGGTSKARQQAHPPEFPSSGFPTVVAKKGAAPKAPHALERITGAHPVVLIYQLLASSEKNVLESTKNDKT